eukprot:12929033-Prorocentrum_lima.AAC.1
MPTWVDQSTKHEWCCNACGTHNRHSSWTCRWRQQNVKRPERTWDGINEAGGKREPPSAPRSSNSPE